MLVDHWSAEDVTCTCTEEHARSRCQLRCRSACTPNYVNGGTILSHPFQTRNVGVYGENRAGMLLYEDSCCEFLLRY